MDNDQKYDIPRSQDGQFQAEAQRMGMQQQSPKTNGEAHIRNMQNVAPSQSFSDAAIERAFEKIEAKADARNFIKLSLNLAFRIALVIAVAVTVLAVMS